MMSTVRKLFWFGGFGLIVVAAWATGIHWQLFLAPLLIGVGLGPVVFSGRFQLEGGIVTILSLWVLGAIGLYFHHALAVAFVFFVAWTWYSKLNDSHEG